MTTFTLDQLKSAFTKPENEGSNLPNNYYPFWNMKDGQSCTVRFLPDANAENPFGFMVEKLMHTLEINGERKSIPCGKMYGDDCPICKLSSEYYKKDDKINGKKYWRKKQYITQALIVHDPLDPGDDGETHEGKIRYLTLGYQIYNVIKAAFESGELEEIPFAFEGGCDFIITKSKQGDYPNYAVGSRFARKATDLTADQIALVESNIIDLSTLLPKDPGQEKLQGMLEAAVTGGTYDDGSNQSAAPAATGTPAAAPTPAPAAETVTDDDADAILQQIRDRKNRAAG